MTEPDPVPGARGLAFPFPLQLSTRWGCRRAKNPVGSEPTQALDISLIDGPITRVVLIVAVLFIMSHAEGG